MPLQLFVHNKLAVHFFYHTSDISNDNHVELTNAELIVPGLPQLAPKGFLEKQATPGRGIFAVYLYGTWLSGKDFTPQNSKQSIIDAISFVSRRSGTKAYDGDRFSWDYKNLHIMANSFGAYFIPRLDRSVFTDVATIKLLAPLLWLSPDNTSQFMSVRQQEKFQQQNQAFLEFLRRGYLFALRGINSTSWDDFFKHGQDEIRREKRKTAINLYHDPADPIIPISSSQYAENDENNQFILHEIKETGHSFEKLYKASL